MTTKKQIPFFLYKRNINKEKSNSSLRKYLVGLTLKMIWHSYLSTFFHINKKNIKNTYLKLLSLKLIVLVFKSFSISLKLLSNLLLHYPRVSLRQMQRSCNSLAFKSFVFNKSLTSKVN